MSRQQLSNPPNFRLRRAITFHLSLFIKKLVLVFDCLFKLSWFPVFLSKTHSLDYMVDQKQKWINFKNDNTVCLCPWSNFSSLNMFCCISMGYPKFFGLWQAPLLISSYKGARQVLKKEYFEQ